MHRLHTFVVATLLLPAAPAAQTRARPVVIRASTVLDGKGGILPDVALGNLRSARPDGDARLDRHAHAHRHAFRS